jgi:hypothetical protein
MALGDPSVQFVLPSLEPWHRWLLGGLFGAYVLELVLHNLGVPVYDWLPWLTFGEGFAPWQVVTRFLVQGATQRAVIGVMLSLMVMYFFLPTIESLVSRKQMGAAVLCGALGGTLLPLAVDATGLLGPSATLGWRSLVFVLPALLGLARPEATILLLVFPAKAKWVLWGELVLLLLFLLVERSLETFSGLGVWLGVVGWWHLLGPGARRRQLAGKAAGIENELRNLRVIDGGKGKKGPGPGPQGRQGRDDWVH